MPCATEMINDMNNETNCEKWRQWRVVNLGLRKYLRVRTENHCILDVIFLNSTVLFSQKCKLGFFKKYTYKGEAIFRKTVKKAVPFRLYNIPIEEGL